ncbi:putative integrin-like protein [Streptomyces formicae]|uniref:Putative integrin-like protein n=1 Tax=Streptomyces formicae TaxID=1616117 RepID=A0A291QCQ3_9ACTN|nr:putative integrin-like protein [Streptomyces formicae]
MTRRTRVTVALCGVAALLLTGCASDGGGSGGDGDRTPPPPLKGTPALGKPADRPDPNDFNGDGYDDYARVLDAEGGGKDERDRATLVVLYGSPKGLLTGSPARLRARSGDEFFTEPHRADLDGDGYTDLVVARGESADWETFALFGGPRGLGAPRPLALEPGTRVQAAGDFNGDGRADLLDGGRGGSGDINAESPGQDPAAVLLGPFDRAAGEPAGSIPLDLGQHGYTSPYEAVVGDVDGDRRTDAILFYDFDAEQDDSAPEGLTSIAYFRGDATKGLVPGPDVRPDLYESLANFDTIRGATIADMDGDGVGDLVGASQVSSGRSASGRNPGRVTVIHGSRTGLGAGRAATVLQFPERRGALWGEAPHVGDVNGDKKADLVVSDLEPRARTGGEVTLLPGDGKGPVRDRAQYLSPLTGGLPSRKGHPDVWSGFVADALLDVDGDGRDDVVVHADEWESGRRGSGKAKHYGGEGQARTHAAFLVLGGTDKGLDPERVRYFTPGDVRGETTLK